MDSGGVVLSETRCRSEVFFVGTGASRCGSGLGDSVTIGEGRGSGG